MFNKILVALVILGGLAVGCGGQVADESPTGQPDAPDAGYWVGSSPVGEPTDPGVPDGKKVVQTNNDNTCINAICDQNSILNVNARINMVQNYAQVH